MVDDWLHYGGAIVVLVKLIYSVLKLVIMIFAFSDI